MTYRLFLDDERFPPSSWDSTDFIICRSYDEAIEVIQERGCPEYMSLDHDLGEEKTGYDFVKTFSNWVQSESVDLPANFNFYVHSQNPIGAENIRKYMEWWLDYINRCKES